jgi:hypothetical protein
MPDDPGLDMIAASTEGVARGAVEPVIQAGRDMTRAVCGDTIDAIDDYFAARIRERTELRRLKTFARARAMCEDIGVDPAAVRLPLLKPIWEGASLEEDESMAERWAALLANASADREGTAISPAFPRILAELTAPEAALLDRLAQQESLMLFEVQIELHPEGRRDDEAVPSEPEFDLHVANLERLALAQVSRLDRSVRELRDEMNVIVKRQSLTAFPRGPEISITDFGRAFVSACTPPTRVQRL